VLPGAGTRVRAGNAMARTRGAVLDGAARGIARYGSRRTTMADIAALGGVAKATLYNHFRRKTDVYRALADAEVRRIGEECAALAGTDLAAALTLAAERVAEHPVVQRLAVDEPEVLAVLAAAVDPGAEHAGPALARSLVAGILAGAGEVPAAGEVDLVLHWVVSHLAMPGTTQSRATGGALRAQAVSRGADAS
jgi:AcrR family transcriptional regulator